MSRTALDPGSRPAGRTVPIAAYFTLFMVLFAVAGGAGIWYSRAAARTFASDEARRHTAYGAQQAAAALDDAMAALTAQLVKSATTPGITAALAQPAGCTLTFTGVGPFSGGHLDLVGPDGSLRCTSLPSTTVVPALPYAGAPWLHNAMADPVVEGPMVDPTTGKLVIVSAVAAPNGAGFLATFLDFDTLGPGLAKRFAGPLDLEFVVTSADSSRILSRSLDPDTWAGTATSATPFAGAAGVSTHLDVDGTDRIYSNAVSGGDQWRVFAGVVRHDALAEAGSFFDRALVIVLVAWGLMLAICAVVYRRIAGPMRALSQSVRAQASGVPSVAITARGPSEVVAIAHEFNELVDKLQAELGDRARAEAAAQESARTYRVLFETNPQPMWIWAKESLAFLSVNNAAIEHYGYSREEFLAMRLADIVPEAAAPGAVSRELEEIEANQSTQRPLHQSGPWRHRKRDGTEIAVEITSHPFDYYGREARFAMAVDVTQRQEYEAQLRHLALHDDLTGLANRTLLVDRLETSLTNAQRHGGTVGILFLDLDRFKLVNDVHGHQAGNELLRNLAVRLGQALRPGDTVARFGGDEFVVLCSELSGETEAISIAARIEGLLTAPFDLGSEVFLTASIGITLSTGDDTADDLLRNADAAMYRAKERGGNRYEIFDDAIRARAMTKLETGNELRRAIERGELRLHYQPEIDLETGVCTGAEALVRWEHPTRGLLAPDHFIPLAEETGSIVPLGAWVLRNACRQAARWRRSGDGPPTISVNLSARELIEPDIVTKVSDALDSAALDPAALCLEITETSLVEDPESAAVVLAALRELGVRISIDDFGTGYSSLLYLRAYPVDCLKIDRSFVAGLGQNHQDDVIVASVVSLAQAFGLRVVAEGVETATQAQALRRMGCDLGQGYLWSRPVPAANVPATFRYARPEGRILAREGTAEGDR
jgi:diguanylate cyclase (GGDEF)-like protein/PAS domain S-box-containing protein